MNNKLLDDARAAGFDVYSDEPNIIYLDTTNAHNWDELDVTVKLAKFAALQIPDGYTLVPIEPTEEMLNNAGKAWNEILSMASGDEYLSWQFALTTKYKAMLDASHQLTQKRQNE